MRLPIITISKFVGTVSLGLLTGVSYTLSAVALPSLLFLPTAPSASQTHTYLTARTSRIQRLLASLAVSTLTLAFVFSPARARHPYLLWTSLVCGLGAAPGIAERLVGLHNTGADEVRRGPIEMEESGVMVTPPTTASDKSDSGDEQEMGGVNGEVVRRGVEKGRTVEAARAGIFGLGFFMAVVGLYGDGA